MDSTGKGSPSSAAGFSVIESLVAALILLFIALGLIPLFARSLRDNSSGNDSTQASNHGKARLEEYLQLPFNNQALTLAAGATTLGTNESWAQGGYADIGDADEGWWPGVPAGRGRLLWNRSTTVRQYGISDLDDGRLDNPLPGGTQPIFVHLKEVEVRLETERDRGNAVGGAFTGTSELGGGRRLTFRVVKPF